jgi:hypothetical protein
MTRVKPHAPEDQPAEARIEDQGSDKIEAEVIHGEASQAARLERLARLKVDQAQIEAELAEDRASRLKLGLPPLRIPPLPTADADDAAIGDWLREFGPFRARPNKKEIYRDWQKRRLQEAKAAFRAHHITQGQLGNLGRKFGRGYA